MNIYLMRHGEASFQAPSDFHRELTENGMFAAQARAESITPAKIVASPLVRAQQTAGIVAATHGLEVDTDDVWDLNSSVTAMCDWLDQHGCENLLVVSHNPLISELASYLTGQALNFATADVIALQADVWQMQCASLITL